jgi:hypothetical protein
VAKSIRRDVAADAADGLGRARTALFHLPLKNPSRRRSSRRGTDPESPERLYFTCRCCAGLRRAPRRNCILSGRRSRPPV